MVDAVKHMAGVGLPLNAAQRNLLAIAYLNVVGPARAAWRTLRFKETELHKLVVDEAARPTHREVSLMLWAFVLCVIAQKYNLTLPSMSCYSTTQNAEDNRRVMQYLRETRIEEDIQRLCNEVVGLVKYVLLPVEQKLLKNKAAKVASPLSLTSTLQPGA